MSAVSIYSTVKFTDKEQKIAHTLRQQGLEDGASPRPRKRTIKQFAILKGLDKDMQERLYWSFYVGAFVRAKWVAQQRKGGK